MRSTPVVVLAALFSCLPVGAVELIDLHDAVQLPAHPTAHPLAHFSLHPPDHLLDVEWRQPAASFLPAAVPAALPAAPLPAPAAAATPVPEPVSVLMLACGLLLTVPGAWAARWSRLGDSESLLKRRHP